MTTFSACLTDLTVLRQSGDCKCYVNRRILARAPFWLQKDRTAHILPTSNISLGLLTLPAPEAGDFVELIQLYSVRVRNSVTKPTEHTPAHYPNEVRDRHWNCCGCHTGAWWRVGKCSLVLNFDTRRANQLQTLCTGFPHAVRRQGTTLRLDWTQYHTLPSKNHVQAISSPHPAETMYSASQNGQ